MSAEREKWDKAHWMAALAGFKEMFESNWDPMSPQVADEVAMKAIEIIRQIHQTGPEAELNLAVIAKSAGATFKQANELEDYFELFDTYDKKYKELGEKKDIIARNIAAKDVVVLLLQLGQNEKLAGILTGEEAADSQ